MAFVYPGRMFALYSDADLADLIAEIKAAVPKVVRGQRVTIGNDSFDRTTLNDLYAFGSALAREKAFREGRSRTTSLIPSRPGGCL
ncbi:hypothetical protein G3N56_07910 [Desulfovibrio sulfodismutans]|uniref:Uncharacterized protein n=1 Tax=Desulfolutivibrio sulfodismutans TaxID=63561 RepID=A0A7K3NKM8_9BACT|nr:hypothetical protein [Desulfolutivibrio sulfodismutans]NDY56667.1 hypothetical protein [Desulfolutivibrio sulfodismutans]QLA11233.1 hypothetical protein GD606_02550 [Desulfolutivibrio sulfodismutans DSM 3696]